MRFLDGITETRKAELMGQLRAVWTHDSTAIHPFYDGNGRLARLIANLPVLHAGYPPVVIPMERREDYIRAVWNCESGVTDLAAFKSLARDAWQTTLDLVKEARE